MTASCKIPFPLLPSCTTASAIFMDIFRRREEVHDLTPERPNLELAVDNFAELVVAFYNNEDKRKMKGILGLNEILSLNSHQKLAAASIDSSCTHSGGYCNGPHEAVSCIVEFRNKLVDINSILLVELTGYVAHSHVR
jgi:hypothetical protein